MRLFLGTGRLNHKKRPLRNCRDENGYAVTTLQAICPPVWAYFRHLSGKEVFAAATINYKEADPECDLQITPNTALETTVSLALSTSLGFGGHNACIAFAGI